MNENPQPHPGGIVGAMTEVVYGKEWKSGAELMRDPALPKRKPGELLAPWCGAILVIAVTAAILFGLAIGSLALWNTVT